jgi:hypothetical protein
MTSPGFFEIYPEARPAMPAGSYTLASTQDLVAHAQHGDETVAVPASDFHMNIDAPRYTLPPDQILSTFPPAGSHGDWRERLPQIVLKRRTLPWERDPDGSDPSPPWLALVVLADGEGSLSADVDVSECVTPGVTLQGDADVPRGKYLQVSQDIVEKAFPSKDELSLLTHVRKVDLSDTELAMGDDDGYLAVILSNRLPQPATGGPDATPLKYTAYLINLEGQLDKLLATEPPDLPYFDAVMTTQYVNPALLAPAPEGTVDELVMGIGAGVLPIAALPKSAKSAKSAKAVEAAKAAQAALPVTRTEIAPYPTSTHVESAAGAWAVGPTKSHAVVSNDLEVAKGYKSGISDGILILLENTYRFPVLVSWDFTCTADGGFERLMNDLEVGLVGTVDEDPPPAGLEVAATGHVALEHRTRQGEGNTVWYRGPLTPQPTQRTVAQPGQPLPLAHVSDQLRRFVPDGREDISLAALFEIGRLLTLSKPMLIASLMGWRAELFGAARARDLADELGGNVFSQFGVRIAGGRNSLEDLVRSKLVYALADLPPDRLAPIAREVTAPRVPDDLVDLSPAQFLVGLGADNAAVRAASSAYGVDGLGAVPVPVVEASTAPITRDKLAMTGLQQNLAARVDQLVASALKVEPTQAAPKDAAPPRPSRRKDALDRLIEQANARRAPEPRREG